MINSRGRTQFSYSLAAYNRECSWLLCYSAASTVSLCVRGRPASFPLTHTHTRVQCMRAERRWHIEKYTCDARCIGAQGEKPRTIACGIMALASPKASLFSFPPSTPCRAGVQCGA
jgi:hypothetical protein